LHFWFVKNETIELIARRRDNHADMRQLCVPFHGALFGALGTSAIDELFQLGAR
jgi:hypothetical protein